MFVKISGIRGSGKTTITPLFVEFLKSKGYNSEHIYGAKMMADFLGVTTDGLDFVSESDRKKARVAVYKKLYKIDRLKPAIRVRDGHFALVQRKQDGSFEVNASDPIDGDEMQLKAIYLLNPPVDIILERRKIDLHKRTDRNLKDLVLLEQELYWEKGIALKQAKDLNLAVYFFENVGTPLETCTKMWQQLQSDLKDELQLYKRK